MGKTKRGKKKTVFHICIMVFGCYIVGSLINLQLDITEKKQELELMNQQIKEQNIANKKLERILNSGEETDYIERIAREKLGFAYPDERVYIDISGN